ncbi:MAG TPA: beta-ketoacyl-[acyl-carrier-protein] synthase family protein [Terracidiphilus sp.]|nr:beta-ketoacyl-[acyl-carrier-protein] synthase family protein [Terracidiphilus sp.]
MIDARKTIVVTGIGVVSPYGAGLSSLQAGMLAGQCCLKPATDLYPGFQGTVAAVDDLPPPAEVHRYSRTDRLAMAAARDAVADFTGPDNILRESGIVMASTVAGLTEIDPEISRGPAEWYQHGGLSRAASYPVSRVAASVGEHLGILGPACTVSVACASGAMAIALAANMLLDDAAPMVLAGGSDALCLFTLSGFNSLQALDPEPCRPFDQSRKGLNIGEGAAVLVLETLAHASQRDARILAVLRGWAMTNDAFHPTAPHKDGIGLALCIQRALEMASCSIEEVDYVNAHGTGTLLNDIAETHAYESAFRGRSRPIPVSSTKSYFGHCLGAAGALEAAITIMAMQSGALLPTLRLENPIENPMIDWLRGGLRRQPLPVAMSVSAGFGGSNTALIFGSHRA